MISDFKTEVRAFILYDFLLKRKVTEAIQNNSQLPEQYRVDHNTIRRWYSKFKKGDYNLKDSIKTGRPITINQLKIKELHDKNPHLSSRELASLVGCSRKSVSLHLLKLGKKRETLQKLHTQTHLN